MAWTKGTLTVIAALSAGLVSVTPPAVAGTPEFDLGFTTPRPGASTGATLDVVYPDYGDPGKPKAVAREVFVLPRRTRFDQTVVPSCTATDGELFTQGLGACPDESRVGSGTGTAVTGFGPPIDPVSADLQVFNGDGELRTISTPPGSDRVLLATHQRIEGHRLIDMPAHDTPSSAPGGPPDGRIEGKSVSISIDPRSAGQGSERRFFITTPDRCPESGEWISRLKLLYEDGTTDRAASKTPCRR
jgi:hypothetical protein